MLCGTQNWVRCGAACAMYSLLGGALQRKSIYAVRHRSSERQPNSFQNAKESFLQVRVGYLHNAGHRCTAAHVCCSRNNTRTAPHAFSCSECKLITTIDHLAGLGLRHSFLCVWRAFLALRWARVLCSPEQFNSHQNPPIDANQPQT